MPLTKTTTVPPDDPLPILGKTDTLKMVVIINDENLVTIADNLAHHPPLADRQVIWFKNGLPVDYATKYHLPNLPDMPHTAAFALSPDNEIKDTILVSETIDYVRVSLAYNKAGQ